MPIMQPAGPNGGYVFADLAQLDSVITQWQAFHDGIRTDATSLENAVTLIEPPAEDGPSGRQATAARSFLVAGVKQNRDMQVYAKSYLDRLIATRAQYANDDQNSADNLRNADPD